MKPNQNRNKNQGVNKKKLHYATISPFSFGDGKDKYRWLLARPWERIVAAIINVICTALIYTPFYFLLKKEFANLAIAFKLSILETLISIYNILMETTPGRAALAGWAVYWILQAFLMSYFGQSIGKMAVGIKVVKMNGENGGFLHGVLLREVIYFLVVAMVIGIALKFLHLNVNPIYLIWLPYVGAVGMLVREENNCQTFQDILGATAVVQAKPIIYRH